MLFAALPIAAMDLRYELTWCANALSELQQRAASGLVPETVSGNMASVTLKNGKKLTVMIGDITTQRVDAIVNAANEQLNYGGGVAGAIYKAAAPKSQLLQELTHTLNPVTKSGVRCPVGSACPNVAVGGLRDYGIKYVIEAVGPICKTKNSPTKQEVELLKKSYAAVIDVVTDINKTQYLKSTIDQLVVDGDLPNIDPDDTIRTLAIPLISADLFLCGRENSITYGIEALGEALEKLPVDALLEEVCLMIYVPGDDAEAERLFDSAQEKVLLYGKKPSFFSSFFGWF